MLQPLGFDWRIGVGILGAFTAREVFVSTMGIVFDIDNADEQSQPLRDALRSARRADGSVLMTPLTGVSLMVFFVLACQCAQHAGRRASRVGVVDLARLHVRLPDGAWPTWRR